MEKIHLNLTGSQFIELLNQATIDFDREAITRLTEIAFTRRNVSWQAAARIADNYILACKDDNSNLMEICEDSFRKLIPQITKGE
jgi:hypothetical protein